MYTYTHTLILTLPLTLTHTFTLTLALTHSQLILTLTLPLTHSQLTLTPSHPHTLSLNSFSHSHSLTLNSHPHTLTPSHTHTLTPSLSQDVESILQSRREMDTHLQANSVGGAEDPPTFYPRPGDWPRPTGDGSPRAWGSRRGGRGGYRGGARGTRPRESQSRWVGSVLCEQETSGHCLVLIIQGMPPELLLCDVKEDSTRTSLVPRHSNSNRSFLNFSHSLGTRLYECVFQDYMYVCKSLIRQLISLSGRTLTNLL